MIVTMHDSHRKFDFQVAPTPALSETGATEYFWSLLWLKVAELQWNPSTSCDILSYCVKEKGMLNLIFDEV